MPLTRVVEVAPERFDGWLERFQSANAGLDAAQRVDSVDHFDHDPVALVLVRRGGYAVGLARGGVLVDHKVGSRYVQSRTAAGGWSQQRFARRRSNQADELVRAVADHAARILGPVLSRRARGIPTGLVTGGDRALVTQVLADPRLAGLTRLPRRDLPNLPDPNRGVLEHALERSRAVRVTVVEKPS